MDTYVPFDIHMSLVVIQIYNIFNDQLVRLHLVKMFIRFHINFVVILYVALHPFALVFINTIYMH